MHRPAYAFVHFSFPFHPSVGKQMSAALLRDAVPLYSLFSASDPVGCRFKGHAFDVAHPAPAAGYTAQCSEDNFSPMCCLIYTSVFSTSNLRSAAVFQATTLTSRILRPPPATQRSAAKMTTCPMHSTTRTRLETAQVPPSMGPRPAPGTAAGRGTAATTLTRSTPCCRYGNSIGSIVSIDCVEINPTAPAAPAVIPLIPLESVQLHHQSNCKYSTEGMNLSCCERD